jgi:hypothetical protein
VNRHLLVFYDKDRQIAGCFQYDKAAEKPELWKNWEKFCRATSLFAAFRSFVAYPTRPELEGLMRAYGIYV